MKTTDQILAEAAETFRTRNAQYKSNYLMVGQLMAALFPDGITLKTAHDHNRFHLFMLMMVKVSRYAIQWDDPHQDSIRDAAVYAAMVEMVDQIKPCDVDISPMSGKEAWKPKFKVGDEIALTEDVSDRHVLLPKGTLAFIREVPSGSGGFYKIENSNCWLWMDEERMELAK